MHTERKERQTEIERERERKEESERESCCFSEILVAAHHWHTVCIFYLGANQDARLLLLVSPPGKEQREDRYSLGLII